MKPTGPAEKIKSIAEAMGMDAHFEESVGGITLIAYRADLRLGFQAYYPANSSKAGTGWGGAIVVCPLGFPTQLRADYTISKSDRKNYHIPDDVAEKRQAERAYEYNDGEEYLLKKKWLRTLKEFNEWVDDWQKLILKEGNYTPLIKPKKVEEGFWSG